MMYWLTNHSLRINRSWSKEKPFCTNFCTKADKRLPTPGYKKAVQQENDIWEKSSLYSTRQIQQWSGADLGFENRGGAGGVIGVLAWSVGLKLGTTRPKIGGGMHPFAPPLDPRLMIHLCMPHPVLSMYVCTNMYVLIYMYWYACTDHLHKPSSKTTIIDLGKLAWKPAYFESSLFIIHEC